VNDFLRDLQVQSSETVLEVDDPEAGPMRFLSNPVRFARTPANLRRRPPRLGEQSEAILQEAGFTSDEIARLRAERVIP